MNFRKLDALDIIGLVCIVIVAFCILKFILSVLYNNFLAPGLGINAVDLRKTGKWAVVTGATDGIGKAYAEALAKKNLNVVLISRTQAKLDEVAASLQSQYKVETKTIAADFTKTDGIYDNIDKQLHELDIGVLINNVGLFYPYPEYFLDLEDKDEQYDNIIKCNIYSVTNMCKIVLPGMVERKRGVIVNVSSSLAIMPCPLVTIYSATKAYVLKFTEDLQTEYKKDGVTIQCVLPGLVSTNMSRKAASWNCPTPAKYVKSALATIGVRDKTTGYFPHTLTVGFSNFADSISSRFTRGLIIKEMLKMKAERLTNVA